MSDNNIEMNQETFWALLREAKDKCGQNLRAEADWITEQLLFMGSDQALAFHEIMDAYKELANRYGLWNAADLMMDWCSDDGFIDFRAWLIAQGKEVYLAALKEPDSLAEVTPYGGCTFESLSYVGYHAYEKLTGRSAYMARYIAKNIVAAGLAEKCTVSLAYAIGKAEPVAVDVDTHLTGEYPDDVISQAVRRHFDLTPSGIIRTLRLDHPIFAKACNYGHFTRSGMPWERTNQTDALAQICAMLDMGASAR